MCFIWQRIRSVVVSVILALFCSFPALLNAKTILIVGDSISAAYGLSYQQGWVTQLQQRLNQQYPKQYNVVNASVSGETTAGALARLPMLLSKHQPNIVVIELGGNDALRGQPPQTIQANLEKLIQHSQQAKAKVVLLGMKIPPNYGTAYSQAFENTYVQVSQKYHLKFLAFFLTGVAGNPQLMQPDLIHPNAKAQAILLKNAYPFIQHALK